MSAPTIIMNGFTGSLGLARFIILVRGRGEPDCPDAQCDDRLCRAGLATLNRRRFASGSARFRTPWSGRFTLSCTINQE